MWLGLLNLATASAEEGQQVVQEAVHDGTADSKIPGFDGKLPTPEQLLEMLDSMGGMSDAEKESLRADLLKNIHGHASGPQSAFAGSDFPSQTIVLLSLLSLVALIFVFFVYKLFKCLSEREMKREEKKKNKQLKKKK